jgi:hypothetical protein
MRNYNFLFSLLAIALVFACTSSKKEIMENTEMPFQLMTLDPGHFHAALVQKMQLEGVDPVVHVFAPRALTFRII